jgi:hypothetical protein
MADAEQHEVRLSGEEKEALQAAAVNRWREADQLLHAAIEARDWKSATCVANKMARTLRLLHDTCGCTSTFNGKSVVSLLMVEDLLPLIPDGVRDALEEKRKKLRPTHPVEAPAVTLIKVSANQTDRLRDQLLIQLTNLDVVALLLEEERWDLLSIRTEEFADYLAVLAEIGFKTKSSELKVDLPVETFQRCLRHLIDDLDVAITIWAEITKDAEDSSQRLRDDREALIALASQSPVAQ